MNRSYQSIETKSRRAERRGLTFVDVVVATMVVGIVAAIAVPRFAVTLERNRAAAAAERICADLRYARHLAITRSRTQRVVFHPSEHRYVLSGIRSLQRASDEYTARLNEHPYRVQLVSVTFGGMEAVEFDLHGQASQSGTVVIAAGSSTKSISLDAATGKAAIP